MSQWSDERAAFEQRLASNFTDAPVAYPGVPFSQPSSGSWVKLALLPGQSKRISLGSNAIFREHSLCLMMIFTQSNQGSDPGRIIADTLAPIFHEAIFSFGASGVIRCQVPSIDDRGATSDGHWYQINLAVPYHRDVVLA